MALAFPVVRRFLAWKVGDGNSVRVGKDAIMVCSKNIMLSNEIVFQLQVSGKAMLSQIMKPKEMSIWPQRWHSAEDLVLAVHHIPF